MFLCVGVYSWAGAFYGRGHYSHAVCQALTSSPEAAHDLQVNKPETGAATQRPHAHVLSHTPSDGLMLSRRAPGLSPSYIAWHPRLPHSPRLPHTWTPKYTLAPPPPRPPAYQSLCFFSRDKSTKQASPSLTFSFMLLLNLPYYSEQFNSEPLNALLCTNLPSGIQIEVLIEMRGLKVRQTNLHVDLRIWLNFKEH